ncbi:MAG: hypothetical protein JRL30_16300, partial [Deltaproteobacteria bacterium]|nr:hypothetical protein [Deltaproteobacteria bacterium]
MKCPKCSFISFDHNQTCPKCGNDLTHEKDLLNLPSFEPKALSLLGALTGAGTIPDNETTMIEQAEISEEHGEAAEELLISLDNLSDGEPELMELGPESAPTGPDTGMEMDTGTSDAAEELSISLDELSHEEPELEPIGLETEMETGAGEAAEELSISLDELSHEEPELE